MKKRRMRPAMRSVSAPPKLAVLLLGGGLNLLRYSTLHAHTTPQCNKFLHTASQQTHFRACSQHLDPCSWAQGRALVVCMLQNAQVAITQAHLLHPMIMVWGTYIAAGHMPRWRNEIGVTGGASPACF